MRALAVSVLTAAMFLGALQPASAEATGYLNVSWTEKDGLPGSYIGSIAQDREGYLWLVANGALVRFDGVRFVEWGAIAPTPQTRIRGAAVVSAARDGSLWIGHSGDGGVSRVHEGRVTSYSPHEPGVPSGVVRSVIEGPDGSIWAASQSGVSRFRKGQWKRLDAEEGLSSDPAYSVHTDRKGAIWVGTAVGVFRLAAEGEKFELVRATLRARGFAEDERGTMWVTGLDHPFRSVRDPDLLPLSPSLLRTASGGCRSAACCAGSRLCSIRTRQGFRWPRLSR